MRVAGMLAIVVVRGVLLWVLLPVGFVGWVLVAPWILSRSVSLGRFLGWMDVNFVAALQRCIPFTPKPRLAFVPFREIETVTHRVKPLLDLW